MTSTNNFALIQQFRAWRKIAAAELDPMENERSEVCGHALNAACDRIEILEKIIGQLQDKLYGPNP